MTMMYLTQGEQPFPTAYASTYRAASVLGACRRNGFPVPMTSVFFSLTEL